MVETRTMAMINIVEIRGVIAKTIMYKIVAGLHIEDCTMSMTEYMFTLLTKVNMTKEKYQIWDRLCTPYSVPGHYDNTLKIASDPWKYCSITPFHESPSYYTED